MATQAGQGRADDEWEGWGNEVFHRRMGAIGLTIPMISERLGSGKCEIFGQMTMGAWRRLRWRLVRAAVSSIPNASLHFDQNQCDVKADHRPDDPAPRPHLPVFIAPNGSGRCRHQTCHEGISCAINDVLCSTDEDHTHDGSMKCSTAGERFEKGSFGFRSFARSSSWQRWW